MHEWAGSLQGTLGCCRVLWGAGQMDILHMRGNGLDAKRNSYVGKYGGVFRLWSPIINIHAATEGKQEHFLLVLV